MGHPVLKREYQGLYFIFNERDFETNSDFLILLSLIPDVVWPLIFQTMNSAGSNNLGLKFQRFTPSGCKDWIS